MCVSKPAQHMLSHDLCSGSRVGAAVCKDGQGCQPWVTPLSSSTCPVGFRLVMVWLRPPPWNVALMKLGRLSWVPSTLVLEEHLTLGGDRAGVSSNGNRHCGERDHLCPGKQENASRGVCCASDVARVG